MIKRIISMISIVVLCFSMSTIAYAIENVDIKQVRAEFIAQNIADMTGTSEINRDIEITESEYKAKGDCININIPLSGENPVVTEMDCGESIAMNLPEEISGEKGIITNDGTVVYTSYSKNLAVSVQALQENQRGVKFDYVRTLITINNSNAPQKYSFDFELPENYNLVKDYDYADEFDEFDCGQVFVVNNENETICTIDPAWAKDADGENLETYYEIEGNTLIQVVCFDQNTAFPVIADPASHPNKTSYYYYDKTGIKNLRDKYTELGYDVFYSGIITCAAYYAQPCAGVCSSFVFMNQCYSGYKYASWNAVYINFQKNYAEVAVEFRWRNGGKNSGYVKDSQKVKYVYQIP